MKNLIYLTFIVSLSIFTSAFAAVKPVKISIESKVRKDIKKNIAHFSFGLSKEEKSQTNTEEEEKLSDLEKVYFDSVDSKLAAPKREK